MWELKGWYLGGVTASEVPVVVQEVFWVDEELLVLPLINGLQAVSQRRVERDLNTSSVPVGK